MADLVAMPLTAFGPDDYAALLQVMLGRGYTDVGLDEIVPEKAHMFLRHDIDLCPARALRMAHIEKSLGVRATYYFLVSTEIYSIADAASRAILSDIVAMGHHIGLHFDAARFASDADLDGHAETECRILELCSGAPVNSISFHRPAPTLLNRAGAIAGRRHCYEPTFFSQIAYVSDSNGGWHHGHPLEHPAIVKGWAVQLLTHPIWWTNDQPISTFETMDSLLAQRQQAIENQLAATVTAYRQALSQRREGLADASEHIGSAK